MKVSVAVFPEQEGLSRFIRSKGLGKSDKKQTSMLRAMLINNDLGMLSFGAGKNLQGKLLSSAEEKGKRKFENLPFP